MTRHILILSFLCLTGATATAQKFPERHQIRSGNRLYSEGKYAEAEVAYRRALEKADSSYEARFNLADALYKQKRYDEAAKLNATLTTDSTHLDKSASAWFNQGNALFQQRKLKDALEAYRRSLLINPTDREAKFNYAYTKKLLDQQQKNDQNKNDKNKDQNKNDKNKDNKDQNKDQNKNNPNDQNQNKPDQQPQGNQPQGMSRDEAERMLDAMQGNEDNTKQKVDQQRARAAAVGSMKNW